MEPGRVFGDGNIGIGARSSNNTSNAPSLGSFAPALGPLDPRLYLGVGGSSRRRKAGLGSAFSNPQYLNGSAFEKGPEPGMPSMEDPAVKRAIMGDGNVGAFDKGVSSGMSDKQGRPKTKSYGRLHNDKSGGFALNPEGRPTTGLSTGAYAKNYSSGPSGYYGKDGVRHPYDDKHSALHGNPDSGLGGSAAAAPVHEDLVRHKVLATDTLTSLAIRYGCTASEIKFINKIVMEQDLHARKYIYIPKSEGEPEAAPGKAGILDRKGKAADADQSGWPQGPPPEYPPKQELLIDFGADEDIQAPTPPPPYTPDGFVQEATLSGGTGLENEGFHDFVSYDTQEQNENDDGLETIDEDQLADLDNLEQLREGGPATTDDGANSALSFLSKFDQAIDDGKRFTYAMDVKYGKGLVDNKDRPKNREITDVDRQRMAEESRRKEQEKAFASQQAARRHSIGRPSSSPSPGMPGKKLADSMANLIIRPRGKGSRPSSLLSGSQVGQGDGESDIGSIPLQDSDVGGSRRSESANPAPKRTSGRVISNGGGPGPGSTVSSGFGFGTGGSVNSAGFTSNVKNPFR
eukprot:Clim_evm8s159 gene=Clim_evmTU8s159